MYCQLLKNLIQQFFKDMLKKLTLKMHEWKMQPRRGCGGF